MLGDVAPATPGYFKAMGIDVLDGREFETSDRDQMRKVAVVDELVAQRFYPKGDVVGQRVIIDGDTLRVVGVVGHVRMYDLQEQGREQLYVPHAYREYRDLAVAIRTAGDPSSLIPAVRNAIHVVDAAQPIANVWTMRQAVRDSLAQRRLVLTLVGVFAAAALLLVALGIYGVTANSVTERTRELGIRVALGADPQRVLGAVLVEPTRLVALGLALGVGGTLVSRSVMRKMLYDVSPTDPITLAAVAIGLLLVAVLASYLPARRATRVDPMIALRSD